MLDYTNIEKRKILDKHVTSYLCKDDDKQGLETKKIEHLLEEHYQKQKGIRGDLELNKYKKQAIS